jgi:acetyltransferase-like isoleucine patch superfamily enzyme
VNPRVPHGSLTLGAGTAIGDHCVFGHPKEARLRSTGVVGAAAPVKIGDRCLIFNHVVVYEGVRIADDVVIEDRVRIGYDGVVGSRSRVVYGAYICDRVSIGTEARVAGFVCDGSIIGDRSTVMGELVHEYTRPHEAWWDVDEEPPVIEADTVIGYGARVIGGVHIGPRSYVAAGAIVTRDVPAEHVVTGINVHTPAERWQGQRLQALIRHWRAG